MLDQDHACILGDQTVRGDSRRLLVGEGPIGVGVHLGSRVQHLL